MMLLKKAIFIKEIKGRFLCEVEIHGKKEICYVSSTSRLSELLNLQNREVLLAKNKGKNLRTKYTLYAVNYNDTPILLNLNELNNIFHRYLLQHNKKENIIKKEFTINNYKTDFYIEKENKIIEIKGIISDSKIVSYSFKKHSRACKQLKIIKELLISGHKVDYVFILLNPDICFFKLPDKRIKENKLFLECINLGLKVRFFKTVWKNETINIFPQKVMLNF